MEVEDQPVSSFDSNDFGSSKSIPVGDAVILGTFGWLSAPNTGDSATRPDDEARIDGVKGVNTSSRSNPIRSMAAKVFLYSRQKPCNPASTGRCDLGVFHPAANPPGPRGEASTSTISKAGPFAAFWFSTDGCSMVEIESAALNPTHPPPTINTLFRWGAICGIDYEG